jgi:hypothetical protein
MNKKGMGIGQVFIFIVAAITFALIMIFGYKTVSDFIDSGNEVAFVQFKTDLEKTVKKIYTEYGSIRIENYNIPGNFEQICFVDMDYNYDGEELQELCDFDQAACDIWEQAKKEGGYGSVDQNVFLKPQAKVPIKVYEISVYDEKIGENIGFLCEKIHGGTFSVVLEGKGDKTEVSKAGLQS